MGYKYSFERLQANEYCVKILSPILIICICRAKIQLDRPYDERFFKRHLNNSGCKRNTQQSILKFFSVNKNKETEINHEDVAEIPQHPCLEWINEEIKKYILRT